jgi:hypothetical protein
MHHTRRHSPLLPLLLLLMGGCGGAPLEVSGIRAEPEVVRVGQIATVTVSAVAPEGGALGYTWSSECPGTWTDADTATAHFVPTEPLDSGSACVPCALSVEVTDGQGRRDTGRTYLCVGPQPARSEAPRIARTFQSASEVPGTSGVDLVAEARDPRGGALTFTWTANVGTVTETGTSAGESRAVWHLPPNWPRGTTPTAEVTVTNSLGLTDRAWFLLR